MRPSSLIGRCLSQTLPLLTLLLIHVPAIAQEWPRATAKPWPEADRLFRSDPRWKGGDGAGSVYLGNDRILWLFGDSFVSSQPASQRRGTTMVNNTLGVQVGRNPETASMKFYWRGDDERPQAFFNTKNESWLWPASAVMIDDRLLILLMQIERADIGLGFRVVGNQGLLVTNPHEEPGNWSTQSVKMPAYRFPVIYGSGGLRVVGKYVYSLSPVVTLGHEAYLLRWPVADALGRDLSKPEWYLGSRWVSDSEIVSLPEVTLPHAQTEFTVHRDRNHKTLVQVQCSPHLSARVGVRFSREWHGPWTEIQYLFDPHQMGDQDNAVFYYAAKAHPYLKGDGLAVTYCSNSRNLSYVVNNESIYYPRFLRITLEQVVANH